MKTNVHWMLALRAPWMMLLRAPEGDPPGGGGEGGEGGDGGDPPAGGEGGDPPGGGAGGEGGDPPAGGAQGNWWEDKRFDDATQSQLKALGLTTEDPLDAVSKLTAMERHAKQKLGKSADELIERPGKDKDVSEWMRENGELFGVPDSPDGYEISPPDDWPEDAPWDKEFEAEARKIGHELGLGQKAMEKFTGLYANKVKGMLGDAERDLQQASAQMQSELQTDWGDQYGAKVALAQQASGFLAEKAGLDKEAVASIASVLKPKIGDANTIRLFAAVGEAAGEDMAAAIGKGGGSMGDTPADARAKLEAMKQPDSEFSKEAEKARKGGNRTRYDQMNKEFQRLQKIASS